MLSVTTAHAISPDARAAYHDSFAFSSPSSDDAHRRGSGLEHPTVVEEDPRAHAASRARARARPSTPAMTIDFAMPSAHHASRAAATTATTPVRAESPVAGIDEVVVPCDRRASTCGCASCS